MGGGRVPGPIRGEDPFERGFTDPIPLGGNSSGGGSVKLTGWPRAIKWGEFRDLDSRPSEKDEDAQIHSEVQQPEKVDVTRDGGRFRISGYTATLVVVAEDTWVVKDQKSDALLVHEQGHYDITGLIGRDMVADIGAVRASSTEDLQKQVSDIIAAANALGEKLTKLYDKKGSGGTNHSRDTDAQKKWNAHLKACKDNGTRLTGGPS
jgi:hypothetical protein